MLTDFPGTGDDMGMGAGDVAASAESEVGAGLDARLGGGGCSNGEGIGRGKQLP